MDNDERPPEVPDENDTDGPELHGTACGFTRTRTIPHQPLMKFPFATGVGRGRSNVFPGFDPSNAGPSTSRNSYNSPPKLEKIIPGFVNNVHSTDSNIGLLMYATGRGRGLGGRGLGGRGLGGTLKDDIPVKTFGLRGRTRGFSLAISPGFTPEPITPYEFRADQLKQPCDLALRNKCETFFIMSADTLNRIYIVPLKERELHILTIADEVNLQCLPDRRLVSIPRVGDVVLAKRGPMWPYVRSVVDKLMTGSNYHQVLVREIDKGRTFMVQWSELKAVNKEIMDIPVIGYYVNLNGVPDSSDLIFMPDFESLIRSLRRDKIRVEVIRKEESQDYVVDLKRRDNKKSIAPEILALGKWQWERILELNIYRNDDDIARRGDWSKCPNNFYTPSQDYGVYFDVEVVGSLKLTTEIQDYITVYLKPVTEQATELHKVLYSQIERYMRMVQPSAYYPAINEKVFILPPDGHNGAGKWQRMIRFDQVRDLFYAVDTHMFYDIPPDNEFYEYRRVLPEFTRIPKMVMEAALKCPDLKDNKIKDAIESTFIAGSKLSIIMLKEDQGELEDVYVIRCEELTTKLSEIEFKRIISRAS